jgi:aspartate aminotransferase
MHISRLASELSDSPTLALNAQAASLREQGKPVIHLGGGEPESPAPKAAVDAGMARLANGKIKYTPVTGTKRVKAAVIEYTRKHYGYTPAPAEIVVSGGAKQALYNFLLAAVDPGDEVVFPAPYWVSYPDMIRMAGGKPVPVAPQKGAFEPRPEAMAAAITPKTRAVILNSPNNPSGTVYSADLVRAMVELCESKGIYMVMDDIYHQLVFAGAETVSCYKFVKKDSSNIVVINGVSKLYGMTGFRIGWSVAHKELSSAMARVQGQTTSCPSDLSQECTAAALEGDQNCVLELRNSLEENRDVLLKELAGLKKLKVNPPKGTFYCLPDFGAYNPDSAALCKFLLEKALVVTVPGKEFGLEGHLRISYCGKKEDIIEGARRICWALDESAPKDIVIGGKTVTRTWK